MPSPYNKFFTDAATEKLIEEISLPPAASKKPAHELPANTLEDLDMTLSKKDPGIIEFPKAIRVEGLKADDLRAIEKTIFEITDSLETYKLTNEKIKITVLDEESARILKPRIIELKRKYPNLELRAKGSAIPVLSQK